MQNVVVVGDSAVGKTILFDRLVNDAPPAAEVRTIGAGFAQLLTGPGAARPSLRLWDTEADPRAACLFFPKEAVAGAIVVFDVCQRTSFDAIPTWIDLVLRSTSLGSHGGLTPARRRPMIALVGSVLDPAVFHVHGTAQRTVTDAEARQCARDLGCHSYHECSLQSKAELEEILALLMAGDRVQGAVKLPAAPCATTKPTR